MEKIVVVYKDFEITYDEFSDRWSVEIDSGKWRERQSLALAKKAVDDWHRREMKTNRFDVYREGRWRNTDNGLAARIVSLTSFTDDGKAAWIVDENGKRGKELLTDLYVKNAHNDDIFTRISELKKNREEIDKSIDELRVGLETVSRRSIDTVSIDD